MGAIDCWKFITLFMVKCQHQTAICCNKKSESQQVLNKTVGTQSYITAHMSPDLRHLTPAILKNSRGQNNYITGQITLHQTAIKEPLLSFLKSLLPSFPLSKFSIIFCIKLQLFYAIYSNKTSLFSHQNIWVSDSMQQKEEENSISNRSICIYQSRTSHKAKFITHPQTRKLHLYQAQLLSVSGITSIQPQFNQEGGLQSHS